MDRERERVYRVGRERDGQTDRERGHTERERGLDRERDRERGHDRERQKERERERERKREGLGERENIKVRNMSFIYSSQYLCTMCVSDDDISSSLMD